MRRRTLLFALPLSAWALSPELEANTATQAQLESLPGVGPALAERILATRPFKDWQDLRRRMKGVGPRLARKLSDQGLRVNGQPYAD